MTLPIDLYPWFALFGSFGLIILFLWHLRLPLRGFHAHQEERTVSQLLMALMFVGVSVGLFLSSLHLFTHDPIWSIVGLSVARGVLLVGGLTLLMVEGELRVTSER